MNQTNTLSLSAHEIKIICTIMASNKNINGDINITDTRYIADTLETSIYNARYLLLKLTAKGVLNRTSEKKRQIWSINYKSHYFSNIASQLDTQI
ncbi:TPA: FaeA/PapI family transcriptional regulator [Citrobacter koseri]